MSLTRLFKFTFLFLVFISCQEIVPQKTRTIDLRNTLKNEKSEILSLVADSIYYISLQTDSNILLDQIKKPWMNVQFSKDRIFICDKKQLLTFDYSGKYINRIGNMGHGPGEFSSIDGFTILYNKKQVAILNMSGHELLIYDFNGLYLKSVDNKTWSSEVASLNNEFLALGNSKGNRSNSEFKTVTILDSNYNVENRLISESQEKEIVNNKKLGRWLMSYFYSYYDSLSHWEFQYDTIWRIAKKNLAIPVYRIELGEDKLPYSFLFENSTQRNRNEFINVERVFESKNFFFLRINNKGYLKHVVYNKSSDNSVCISHIVNGQKFVSFINDIDGGLPFWPDGVINGEKAFSLIYGYQLVSKLEENRRQKIPHPSNFNLEQLIKNTKLIDNPIIMIVKLKTF